MTNKEAKIFALKKIWGWTSYMHEGMDKGEFGDDLGEEVFQGRLSEEDAKKIQKALFMESERIIGRLIKLRK